MRLAIDAKAISELMKIFLWRVELNTNNAAGIKVTALRAMINNFNRPNP
jgi:hypothetical protein